MPHTLLDFLEREDDAPGVRTEQLIRPSGLVPDHRYGIHEKQLDAADWTGGTSKKYPRGVHAVDWFLREALRLANSKQIGRVRSDCSKELRFLTPSTLATPSSSNDTVGGNWNSSGQNIIDEAAEQLYINRTIHHNHTGGTTGLFNNNIVPRATNNSGVTRDDKFEQDPGSPPNEEPLRVESLDSIFDDVFGQTDEPEADSATGAPVSDRVRQGRPERGLCALPSSSYYTVSSLDTVDSSTFALASNGGGHFCSAVPANMTTTRTQAGGMPSNGLVIDSRESSANYLTISSANVAIVDPGRQDDLRRFATPGGRAGGATSARIVPPSLLPPCAGRSSIGETFLHRQAECQVDASYCAKSSRAGSGGPVGRGDYPDDSSLARTLLRRLHDWIVKEGLVGGFSSQVVSLRLVQRLFFRAKQSLERRLLRLLSTQLTQEIRNSRWREHRVDAIAFAGRATSSSTSTRQRVPVWLPAYLFPFLRREQQFLRRRCTHTFDAGDSVPTSMRILVDENIVILSE